MQVIKHGNTYKKIECSKCNAILEFGAADIITHSFHDDGFGYYHEWDMIKCPDCGFEIILNERTIEI